MGNFSQRISRKISRAKFFILYFSKVGRISMRYEYSLNSRLSLPFQRIRVRKSISPHELQFYKAEIPKRCSKVSANLYEIGKKLEKCHDNFCIMNVLFDENLPFEALVGSGSNSGFYCWCTSHGVKAFPSHLMEPILNGKLLPSQFLRLIVKAGVFNQSKEELWDSYCLDVLATPHHSK